MAYVRKNRNAKNLMPKKQCFFRKSLLKNHLYLLLVFTSSFVRLFVGISSLETLPKSPTQS